MVMPLDEYHKNTVESSLHIQLPNVTEIINSYAVEYITEIGQLKNLVRTKFIFATTAPGTQNTRLERLNSLGFKNMGSMNNWYHLHSSHYRQIQFHWLKINENATPQSSYFRRWGSQFADGENHNKHLAGSGCGFKIHNITNMREIPTYFHKYFSLLQLPADVTKNRKRAMERYNYRLIDYDDSFSYWLNGWDSKTYNYYDVEKLYWDKYQKRKDNIRAKRLPKTTGETINGNR